MTAFISQGQSVKIGEIEGESAIITYDSDRLWSAIRNEFTLSRLDSVELVYGPDQNENFHWWLKVVGVTLDEEREENGFSFALSLSINGNELSINQSSSSTAFAQTCSGVQCSQCFLSLYSGCHCLRKATKSGYCNHSTTIGYIVSDIDDGLGSL